MADEWFSVGGDATPDIVDWTMNNIATNLESNFRMGIVGHGFVGQAVDYGFESATITKFYCDPKYDKTINTGPTIDDLIEWGPQLTFVCIPTPMGANGQVDATAVEDTVLKIIRQTGTAVVLKSTVPPDIIDRIYYTLTVDELEKRFVYNPEFLTEGSSKQEFINPQFHIMGGHVESTVALQMLYEDHSLCKPATTLHMSPVEASFVKYAINSFLATKVTFFNQLYDAVEDFGGSWNKIMNAVAMDERIGHSHTRVPGFDMKRGYGGACFPKDVNAFTKFSKHLTLLEKVTKINNGYRLQYDLDEREIAQNVTYGQTKEELKDFNDGSPSNI